MKFVAMVLGAVLATACYANAEPAPAYAGPPGGYIAGPAPMVVAPAPVVAVRMPPPQGAPANAPLRAEVMARFDRNGDGVLEPNERRQAIRALRRIARQLARETRRERRVERRERLQGAGPGGPPPPRAVDVDDGY
jgi:uncharacterized membrane protein